MTIKQLIESASGIEPICEYAEVYVNGEPADEVSFGILPGTNQMVVNIEHYY